MLLSKKINSFVLPIISINTTENRNALGASFCKVISDNIFVFIIVNFDVIIVNYPMKWSTDLYLFQFAKISETEISLSVTSFNRLITPASPFR